MFIIQVILKNATMLKIQKLSEMQIEINKLTDEKARAEAKLEQLEEIKKGMESVFKSLASDIAKENRKDFLTIIIYSQPYLSSYLTISSSPKYIPHCTSIIDKSSWPGLDN